MIVHSYQENDTTVLVCKGIPIEVKFLGGRKGKARIGIHADRDVVKVVRQGLRDKGFDNSDWSDEDRVALGPIGNPQDGDHSTDAA